MQRKTKKRKIALAIGVAAALLGEPSYPAITHLNRAQADHAGGQIGQAIADPGTASEHDPQRSETPWAESSPPPRFIFGQISAEAIPCSHLGSEWRIRVTAALRLAQADTEDFLPPASWSTLISTVSTVSVAGDAVPSKPAVDACERFVTEYSDPMYSSHLRGQLAAGLLMKAAAGCAAEFPSLADRLKLAWREAFKRNGADPLDQLFDEQTQSNWRRHSVDEKDRPECERTVTFLAGADFDVAMSAQNIREFLSHAN
jgi:hypothetical protein